MEGVVWFVDAAPISENLYHWPLVSYVILGFIFPGVKVWKPHCIILAHFVLWHQKYWPVFLLKVFSFLNKSIFKPYVGSDFRQIVDFNINARNVHYNQAIFFTAFLSLMWVCNFYTKSPQVRRDDLFLEIQLKCALKNMRKGFGLLLTNGPNLGLPDWTSSRLGLTWEYSLGRLTTSRQWNG